jgi:N-terminal glutamine amidase
MLSPENSATCQTARPQADKLETPLLPTDDASYTSCYCEENVYLLARSFLARPHVTENWDINVVFISNPARSVRKSFWAYGHRFFGGEETEGKLPNFFLFSQLKIIH